MKKVFWLLGNILLILASVSMTASPALAEFSSLGSDAKRLTGAAIATGITLGEDWSFPEGVQKSPLSGLFQMGGETPLANIPSDLSDL
ncbi:MAG: hypothetical protein PVH17_13305, partial [Anaerolineae bacterium]